MRFIPWTKTDYHFRGFFRFHAVTQHSSFQLPWETGHKYFLCIQMFQRENNFGFEFWQHTDFGGHSRGLFQVAGNRTTLGNNFTSFFIAVKFNIQNTAEIIFMPDFANDVICIFPEFGVGTLPNR